MKKVTIEFETEEVARNFVAWMCNQGEQDYWTGMDQERHAIRFDYGWHDKGKPREIDGAYVVKIEEGTVADLR